MKDCQDDDNVLLDQKENAVGKAFGERTTRDASDDRVCERVLEDTGQNVIYSLDKFTTQADRPLLVPPLRLCASARSACASGRTSSE